MTCFIANQKADGYFRDNSAGRERGGRVASPVNHFERLLKWISQEPPECTEERIGDFENPILKIGY